MGLIYSVLPLIIFTVVLIYMDSFKLIEISRSVMVFAAGIFTALVAFQINSLLLGGNPFHQNNFTILIAPLTEEILKFAVLIYIIRKGYSGFIIDTAIYGFIIGSGFAFSENLYYFFSFHNGNIMTDIVRGFGTAVMHGAGVSLAGSLFIFLRDSKNMNIISNIILSLAPALLLHSLYNMFLMPPVYQAAGVLILFATAISLVFSANENSIKQWIDTELDTEIELITLFEKGQLSETKTGKYITEIKHRFSKFTVFDMLCLVKLQTELSMELKVNMMLRMNNLSVPENPELKAKIIEYGYLVKSIGKTGLAALKPVMHTSSKDIWKMNIYLNK